MGDEFKVPPGGTLEIDLRRKRQRKQAVPRKPERQGILPIEAEPVRYVRRDALELVFYDLGTRLQRGDAPSTDTAALPAHTTPETEQGEYHEYLPLDLSASNWTTIPSTNPANVAFREAQITVETMRELEARLLDGEPFGTALATSGRKLPRAAQLPFVAQGLGEDAALWTESRALDETLTFTICDGEAAVDADGEWEWKARGEKPADADELWNPRNDRQYEYEGKGVESWAYLPGSLSVKKQRPYKLLTFLTGNPFFHLPTEIGPSGGPTDPARLKMTAEADPTAEAVTFNYAGRVRVYLAPSIRAYYLEYLFLADYYVETSFNEDGHTWNPGDWWGSRWVTVSTRVIERLPVYPKTNTFVGTAQATRGLNYSVRQLLTRADAFADAEALEAQAMIDQRPNENLTGVPHSPVARRRGVWFAHLPHVEGADWLLSAVVAKGSKLFYVWKEYEMVSPTIGVQLQGEMSLKPRGVAPPNILLGPDDETAPSQANAPALPGLDIRPSGSLTSPTQIDTAAEFQEDHD